MLGTLNRALERGNVGAGVVIDGPAAERTVESDGLSLGDRKSCLSCLIECDNCCSIRSSEVEENVGSESPVWSAFSVAYAWPAGGGDT